MYLCFLKVHNPNNPSPRWKGKSPGGGNYLDALMELDDLLRARGGHSERQQQGNEYKAMHEGLHGCGYREPAAGCVNFTAASVNACTNDAPALMRFARVM